MHAPSGGRFGAVLRTHTMPLRRFATPVLALLIAACTSSSYREPPRVSVPPAAPPPSAPPPSGKYYLDDGPGRIRRPTSTPFPTPCRALEPLHRSANRPYTRARPRLRAGDHAQALPGARHRVVVRAQVPRPEDVDRRDLRHVRDDGRAPDAAAAVVRARDQRRDRQERGRARQRSRPVPARPRHRPVVRRRAPARHRAEGQRRSRGRGDPARRHRASLAAAAPLPPVAARRRHAPPADACSRAADRRARRSAGRSGRRRFRRSSSARSRTTRTRRISSRTCRTNSRPRRSKRKSGRQAGCFASMSGRIRTATKHARVGERLTQAFGFATSVAPH